MEHYLFTSESVTEGHPDKVADQISDGILDHLLAQDANSRVACETMITDGLIFIAGEITTSATHTNYQDIARQVVRDIGYNHISTGFDADACAVITSINKQSPDIAAGVDREDPNEQGAGDQGMMFGFATKETPTYMPAPIYYAHRLSERLAKVRKDNIIDWLYPDGKTEVCVEYAGGTPKHVRHVVIACQHEEDMELGHIEEVILRQVVNKVLPDELLFGGTKVYVNTAGRFVIGGPKADCGLTGRKIIQDTYGGIGGHGGGAFSGKDPSKVDRSGAYMARYVAKNVVAAGLSEKCEVQIAYAIGVAQPISVYVNTYGTGILPDSRITEAVKEVFDLRPYNIIKKLSLLAPIYKENCVYGHFGKNSVDRVPPPWERLDSMADLLSATKVI